MKINTLNTKDNLKRDIVFLSIVSLSMLLFMLILTHGEYYYGCRTDWASQHSVIPEYFRQTFYNTGDLFPDFNLSLGAGQSAYNFSYYGFFSPIILISYLLPWVSMETYVTVSTFLIVILSIILFFVWLRKKDWITPNILYLSTIIFACSTSLTYHSHMQVMFMDYMPFIIMALMGIDSLIYKKKGLLLTLSISLMFLTSFYFAFSGMFVISLYVIYVYIEKKEKALYGYEGTFTGNHPGMSFKDTFSGSLPYVLRYIYCCITGILISCAIILPAFISILAGRQENTGTSFTLVDLLMPDHPIFSLCYSSYGIGTIAIFIIALLSLIFLDKSSSVRFLGVSSFLLCNVTICKYILNGFLYIRPKALIPFIPLAIFISALFLTKAFKKIYSLKGILIICIASAIMSYFSRLVDYDILCWIAIADIIITAIALTLLYKWNQTKIIICSLTITAVISCVYANISCELMLVTDAAKYYNQDKATLIESTLENEDKIVRTTDLCNSKYTCNHIFGDSYYSTGLYSSVVNQLYMRLCNYELSLNNPTLNDISIIPCHDVLFNTLMGTKYICSTTSAPAGYEPIASKDKYTMYQTDNNYSLGFATTKTMSLDTFSKLSAENKQLALLEYIVTDDGDDDVSLSSMFEKVDINLDMGLTPDEEGYYRIDTDNEPIIYTFDIPDNLKEYVYVIKCHIKEYSSKRGAMKVNGFQNLLSSYDNAFPNQNFDFKFVVSSNVDLYKLVIEFPIESGFDFKDLEVYKIKYDDVKKLKDTVTPMENITFTDNSTIEGKIALEKNSTFTTTIPYDEGFTTYIDGNKVEHFKTDTAFVGFKIPAGEHSIKIIYRAPFAFEGRILSIIGLIALVPMLIPKRTRKKKH